MSQHEDETLFPAFDTCPSCENPSLHLVSTGQTVNFACAACGRCWHVELGWVHEVDPAQCPSCRTRGSCSGAVIDQTEAATVTVTVSPG